jgi:hypothetical protein
MKYKAYFNLTDKIVISIGAICLILIFIYKLYLIPVVFSDLLIDKKDIIADIIYAILLSSFAAGLFYFTTVFIPKYNKTKQLILDIPINIKHIDAISSLIIEELINKSTGKKYTLQTFMKTPHKEAKEDFSSALEASPQIIEDVKPLFHRQINYLQYILVNYTDILPLKITNECNYLITISMNVFNIKSTTEYSVEQAFYLFCLIQKNISTFKLYYFV